MKTGASKFMMCIGPQIVLIDLFLFYFHNFEKVGETSVVFKGTNEAFLPFNEDTDCFI